MNGYQPKQAMPGIPRCICKACCGGVKPTCDQNCPRSQCREAANGPLPRRKRRRGW